MGKRAGHPKKHRSPTRAPRYEDIVQEYQRDYQSRMASADPEERHRALQTTLSGFDLEHLQRSFGRLPIASIQSPMIVKYAVRRQEKGASIPTVNHELETLVKLLRFAVRAGKLETFPRVERLLEDRSPSSTTFPAGTIAGSRIARLLGMNQGHIARMLPSTPRPLDSGQQGNGDPRGMNQDQPRLTAELLAECREKHAHPQRGRKRPSYTELARWLGREHRVKISSTRLGLYIRGKASLPS
jgi:hypothetical protein